MLTCQFCGLSDAEGSELFELDRHGTGFWCSDCDGFTYLNETDVKHRFTLILEDKHAGKSTVAPPNIKLAKRLSPYRYPGGKSKIIEYLASHLQATKSKTLVSPFTGGGGFELAMLDAGLVQNLHLNDLDTGVYSLWWVIKHMPYTIIERLRSASPTHKDYFKAQGIIKRDYVGVDALDAAWASLIVNRLAYSGIPYANPLGGKKGTKKALLSRWNPISLENRIHHIHSLSQHITITQLNAVELIEEAYWQDDASIFIDPPYVEQGKRLYHCNYSEQDHRELSQVLDTLHMSFPGADIIVTYDYNKWLDDLYDYPQKEVISRTYSI
ncbi:DNA adenine methylase [Aneurinibacillus tyrosinisolvens]|uniref:DNA adenine methylase n=1 Tax=Aneurinibacillus tyrosinisolvens TaxID=1443435 RepID=UPI00063F6D30|nr:DNA adenine methylase [Aneurinibacillus tyrosinisolvens]